MNLIYFVVLTISSVFLKQVYGAVSVAFLKEYDQKVCQNEPTCNLTTTPNLPASKLTLGGRDCMCDFECPEYNDCCRDSEYFEASAFSNKKKTHICHPAFNRYMVVSCPAAYADATVKRKCDKGLQKLDEDDTVVMLPVTNKKKRVTYANAYCALCNDDTDFELWTLGAGCGELDPKTNGVDYSKYNRKLDQILPLAHYNASVQQFTATYEGKELRCSFTAKMPHAFDVHTRKCYSNMVSTCAANAEGNRKCQEYMAIVSSKATKTPYRNRDCAICNGVPADDLTGCSLGVRTGASALFSAGSKAAGSDACSNPEIAKKFC